MISRDEVYAAAARIYCARLALQVRGGNDLLEAAAEEAVVLVSVVERRCDERAKDDHHARVGRAVGGGIPPLDRDAGLDAIDRGVFSFGRIADAVDLGLDEPMP